MLAVIFSPTNKIKVKMNTAIVSNKSVFELAQSKGYIPTDYTLNENGFHGYLSDNEYYLEMCFIQKWLRDTHKMFVQIELATPYDLKASVIGEGMELHCNTIRFSIDQYNEATLYCIEKALQLI